MYIFNIHLNEDTIWLDPSTTQSEKSIIGGIVLETSHPTPLNLFINEQMGLVYTNPGKE